MYSKTEKQYYKRYHPNKPAETIPVLYTLWFEKDSHRLIDVRNEFGHSVEKKSEVWEYFDNKYNNL